MLHYEATERGDLDTLKHLFETKQANGKLIDCCALAIEKNHIHILEWYVSRGLSHAIQGGLDITTNLNSLDTLKWLEEHGLRVSADVICSFIVNNHVAILEWYHSQSLGRLIQSGLEIVTKPPSIETIEWLCKRQYKIPTDLRL